MRRLRRRGLWGEMEHLDPSQTLNALLQWEKESGRYSTAFVERVNSALDVPVKDLKWSQIRMLISQNIGLQFLVPWAIDALMKRPLYRAEFYDGDLFVACLGVEGNYWTNNLEQWHALSSILADLDSAMNSINEARVRFEVEVFHS